MILGTDAAGMGRGGRGGDRVSGDRRLLRRWTLPCEEHPGTLAERVALPATALLEMPPELSFEQAACLSTAYLTAFRMLFTCGGVGPGDRVLVQGASGRGGERGDPPGRGGRGERHRPAAAARAARELAESLGAARIAPGERLRQRVDAVIETVGEATWEPRSARYGAAGGSVVAGGTSGVRVPLDLERLYLRRTQRRRHVDGDPGGPSSRCSALIVAAGVRLLIDRARTRWPRPERRSAP